MRRGDICYADLDPALGSEANKRRPVLIVSNNAANDAAFSSAHGVVTVVPLTSNVAFVRAYQVFVPADESGLPRDSKAQIEQVRAISTIRCGDRVGSLRSPIMAMIGEALRRHLAL